MAIRSKDLTRLSPDARADVARQMAPKRTPTPIQGEAVTITLPLPPKSLSPNWRGHWRIKAHDVAEYRSSASFRAYCAIEGERPLWPAATLQATFYHAQNHRRDPDNLNASLKSAQDGLVDAGLLADDEHVTRLPVVKLIDRDRPRVVLTITRETPA